MVQATNCFNNTKESLRAELNEAVKKRLKKLGNPTDFEATVAIREVTDEALAQAKQAKRQKQLRFLALRQVLDRVEKAQTPEEGILSIYRDVGRSREFTNVELRMQSLIAENNGLMPGLAKLRPKVFSWTVGVNKKWNADIRKEAMGIASNNPEAKQIAKEMQAAIKDITRRYRVAGGQVKELESWFLPQDYDPFAVGQLKSDQWADLLLGSIPEGAEGAGKPIIDRAAMKAANERIMDDDSLREALEFSWESITTGGLNKWKEPIGGPARPSLAKRRDAARILHFTPEGWLYINSRFGNEDTINSFLTWRDAMAQDTAIMQLLGPNPDWVKDAATNVVSKLVGNASDANTIKARIDGYHDRALGRYNQNPSEFWNATDKLGRSASTAIMLGAAFIPAVGDFSTQSLNSLVTKSGIRSRIGGYLKFMQNSEDSVSDAIHNLMVVDTVLSNDSGMRRFSTAGQHLERWHSANQLKGSAKITRGMQSANQFTTRSANAVLEKTLLTPHTNAGRLAAIQSHLVSIGRDLGRTWDDLPSLRRSLYEGYGIDEAAWSKVSAVAPETTTLRGTRINRLDLNRLRDSVDEATFRRVHEMILAEANASVLSTDIASEKMLDDFIFIGSSNDSRAIGKLANNWAKMFKRFPAAAAMNLARVTRNPKLSTGTKAWALGNYFVWSMTLGAIALQSKQIIAGKTPLDLDDPTFWMSAALYGGGVPFVGDVLTEWLIGTSDPYEYESVGSKYVKETGQAAALLAAMPPVSIMHNLLRPVIEATDALFEGDVELAQEKLAGQGVRKAAETAFGLFGGNAWMVRPFMQRWIFDQWEAEFAPSEFRKRVRRQEDYMRERGQEFFWAPGMVAPE